MVNIAPLQGMTVKYNGSIKFDCGCCLAQTKNVGEYEEIYICDWRRHPQHKGWLIEEAKRIFEAHK
jgi:hypothetical protein